jgi:hypothetical protein
MTEPRDPVEAWLSRQPVEQLPPYPGAFDRIARVAHRRRWAKAAGAAATVLVLVTGVAGVIKALPDADRTADSPPTATGPGPTAPPQTSAPNSPNATPPTSVTPSPELSPSTQPGGGRCTAAELRVSLVPGDNPAGHIGLHLVFTNISARTCTMFGHPGVAFVTGPSGSQINDPAQRSSGQASSLVTLAPNGRAHASLLLVNVDNYNGSPSCQPTQAAGVRVYPPDDTTAIFASSPQRICSVKGTGVPQIYPVESG